MRKVVAYELLSLDGVAERPDDFITDWDDAMNANLGRVIASQDAVLLGRRTYDEWAGFWPSSEIQPFAHFINNTQKYVVTSTPVEQQWGHTEEVHDDVTGFVTDLKHGPGGDIGIHGSITLTQSLLADGLVDELRLVIAPSVQGVGRRLLETRSAQRLSLLRSAASPSGYLLVDFRIG